jgi:hypothetical protein
MAAKFIRSSVIKSEPHLDLWVQYHEQSCSLFSSLENVTERLEILITKEVW